MKRIIFAVVVAFVSLSVVTLTTLAAWTSSVTVSNNVITTGSVSLNVSLDGTTYTKSVSSSATISGLMPNNAGSRGTVFYIKNDSSTGVSFNLTVTGTGTITGSPAPVDLTSLEIAIIPNATTLDGTDYHTLSAWSSSQTLGSLSAGSSAQYDMYARLSSSAADDWQGRSVNFAITVTGSQL